MEGGLIGSMNLFDDFIFCSVDNNRPEQTGFKQAVNQAGQFYYLLTNQDHRHAD